MTDGIRHPAWAADVLARAAHEGTATVVGLCVLDAPAARADRRARTRAERAYLALEHLRYGSANARDLPAELALAPGAFVRHLAARPDRSGALVVDRWRDALGDEADVVWYLGRTRLAEPLPALAPLGVWALDPPGAAPGARAMLSGAVATETCLRRLGEPGTSGCVLARVRTSTQRISAAVNRAEHLRHLAEAVVGWLRRGSRLGPAAVRSAEPPSGLENPVLTPADAGSRPLSVGEALRLAGRTAGRLGRALVQPARADPDWRLAYHLANDPSADGAATAGVPALDGGSFREIVAPPGRYWADPFPVVHEGRYLVFFEEHLAGVAHAHLSVAEFDPAHGLVRAREVLRCDHHLSFPSVFRWGGEWYLTPEAGATRAVPLYRAARFPDRWEHVGDLVTGARFVDPVVAELHGRWWLFVGVMEPGALEANALHLYHAPAPLGPWQPHQLNPVVVDVRRARPAGRVFCRGGHYYRPVQDGAPHYGRAMAIHRIDALTPTTFRETPVARIDPTWRPGLASTHTLNSAGGLTLLDAEYRGPGGLACPV